MVQSKFVRIWINLIAVWCSLSELNIVSIPEIDCIPDPNGFLHRYKMCEALLLLLILLENLTDELISLQLYILNSTKMYQVSLAVT